MLFFLILAIPLALAWTDWFRVPDQRRSRRTLATVGLILLSLIPVLSITAIAVVARDHGRTLAAIRLEQWMFLIGALSIPFLLFGYRMTRWFGLVTAIFLPFLASFVDTLY
jgi:hypothetical protein